jgi:hypothetical protein
LTLATPENYANARVLYENGAFSAPMAEVLLDEFLETSISEESIVVGTGADITGIVKGFAAEHYATGERNLLIAYNGQSDCKVGGNPDPQTSGCKKTCTSLIWLKNSKDLNMRCIHFQKI